MRLIVPIASAAAEAIVEAATRTVDQIPHSVRTMLDTIEPIDPRSDHQGYAHCLQLLAGSFGPG